MKAWFGFCMIFILFKMLDKEYDFSMLESLLVYLLLIGLFLLRNKFIVTRNFILCMLKKTLMQELVSKDLRLIDQGAV